MRTRIFIFIVCCSLLLTGSAGILASYEDKGDYSPPLSRAVKSYIVDCNGGGNYTTINAAISAASDGDTIYVWDGTYTEDIIISKSLTIIGNGTNKTVIKGVSNPAVVNITADNVNVFGLYILNSTGFWPKSGIAIWNSDNCKIYNCNFSNVAPNLIFLYRSSNNEITDIYSTKTWIIKCVESHRNIFVNANRNSYIWFEIKNSNYNRIRNCPGSINLYDSNYNIIENNVCEIYLERSSNNTIANNTCNNGPNVGWTIRLEDRSKYNLIKNNSIISLDGINIADFSDFNTITSNRFCSFMTAALRFFGVEYSSHNFIEGNTFSNGAGWAIDLGGSKQSILRNNIMKSCGIVMDNIVDKESWTTHDIDS